MYQLPVMSALIHMSYGDNTFNGKRINMLKNMVASLVNPSMDCIYKPIATPLDKLIKDKTILETYSKLFYDINDHKETDVIFYYGVLEDKWDPKSDMLKSYQRRSIELGKEFIKKGLTVSVYGQHCVTHIARMVIRM